MNDYLLTVYEKFTLFWKNYIFQSLLASLTIFAIFFVLSIKQAVIIASIGASAFIVFAIPKSDAACPRKLIGGHMVGLIAGSLCALMPDASYVLAVVSYSLAVGLTTFLMVTFDVEHPPAAGTALGVALLGFSMRATVVLVVSVGIMAILHRALKSHLKDLT